MEEYWLLIETLEFPVIGAPKDADRVRSNLKNLQEAIKLSPREVTICLLEDLELEHLKSKLEHNLSDINDELLYIIYSLYTMRKICCNVASNIEAQLISEIHKSMIVSSLQDIAEYGLKSNLHPAFYKRKGSIFARQIDIKTNFFWAEILVASYSSILQIQSMLLRTVDEILLYYMAAVFSLLMAFDSKEHVLEPAQANALQMNLQKIWTRISKKTYYSNLMLIHGMLPAENQQRVFREMLQKLWSPGGFVALLFALQKPEDKRLPSDAEVVASLVAQPSYSAKAQRSLVNQILKFLPTSIGNQEMMSHISAAALSLRKLYDNNSENKDLIKQWLHQQMQPMLETKTDCLTVMEWSEFCNMICILFQIFCTSSIECLPSELLVVYLPVLMACYQQTRCYNNQDAVCGHISSLILNILNNRSKAELHTLIKHVALNRYPQDWFQKHPQITIEENPLSSQELRIVQTEAATENEALFCNYIHTLATILKDSSFNTLSYQLFIALFRLIPMLQTNEIQSLNNTGLLASEDEIQDKVLREISARYNEHIQIINALQSLIHHKPIKCLIKENTKEILCVLQEILTAYTSSEVTSIKLEVNAPVITILLILIREILENVSAEVEDVQKLLSRPLEKLHIQVQDQSLKSQISSLQKQIRNESASLDANDSSKEQFEQARSLIESNEPYIQVEGIEKFIKLINEKDEFTISNIHIVTALALSTLTSTESYTFLNCVRLFAALVHIQGVQILDLLADDYINESVSMDHRLVIGETLLRVCRELGQCCYKYKALLLNSFMCGCRSPSDEFRFSSFSNLAQLCRILTYDVHNYFEELLHLIDCELTTGKYLPAKRAAVMVLSELLDGMENLFDYEEMLLPIYRLLKYLVVSENCDEKIRIHASNGLENLSLKCKQLLANCKQQQLEKEIQIMGVGDKSKRKLKDHILYMN